MKKWILATLAFSFISPMAWAETAAQTELLSAQLAYQQALKNQTDYASQVSMLQTRLREAQQSLEQKQAEVARLQNQLNEADTSAQTAKSTLDAAGARLDAAWAAVRIQ